MEYIPYLWVIIGVIFIIAELLTPGFVLLWFGIGSFLAALIGWLGLGLGIQVGAFLATSLALTIASRTIFDRIFMRNAPGSTVRLGIESLPGQVGTVIEVSQGPRQEAVVKVYGSSWTAFPVPGEEPLHEGEQVEVERVDGNVLYVRKHAPLASWRQQDRHFQS